MQLLEREPLLNQLEEHLRQAADGHGRVVLVGGEAVTPAQVLGIALVLSSLVIARPRVTPPSPPRTSSSRSPS